MKRSLLALAVALGVSLTANAAVEGTYSVGAAAGWNYAFDHNFGYKAYTFSNGVNAKYKEKLSDRHGYGFKLNGEYNFTDWFALGAAYDYLNGNKYKIDGQLSNGTTLSTGDTKLHSNIIELYGRIAMPLDNNGSDIFFKVGPTYNMTTLATGHSREWGAVAGIGAQWAVNNQLALRAGYDYLYKAAKTTTGERIDNGLLYVGVQYTFGKKEEPVVAPKPAPRKTVRITENHSLAAGLLFPFDGSNLSAEGKKAINDVVSSSDKFDNTEFEVYGYTDRLGSDAYNNKLSQRRADAVSNELQAKGVKVNVSEGKGKSSPVTGNKCDGVKGRTNLINCLAPDRRVEIVVTGDTTREEIQ